MLIDISDVISCEGKEKTCEVPIEMMSFTSRLGEFPITGKTPVALRMANQDGKKLLIQGEADVCMLIPCGRCLEEVPTDIHCTIEKEFILDGSEISANEMEEDTDYLIGSNLDIDKLMYGEILVNWPMKVLCSEDCKGICKVCGSNLNHGECGCQRTELDPRMAAIQDIFNKFKEV